MRIERISENQIKFTLTQDDLSHRNMQLHELSYGSLKAQELFREIMQRAAGECDFHTSSETPLIIEAIPVSRDGIMVIVTKVTNQAELDQRFGFPPFPVFGARNNQQNQNQHQHNQHPHYGQHPHQPNQGQSFQPNFGNPQNKPPVQLHKNAQSIFEFKDLDTVADACARISGVYIGNNALYKYSGKYYLTIDNDKINLPHAQENALKEYGDKFSNLEISALFLKEHGDVVVENNAVGILAEFLSN
ncbi:MAG: adaptor protein MecA [Defluviitaleaceae bacterium]|nr:adaptor protein MecA [Defluviitaleaceae bacterium]MCL2235954.1 adaptor protein MecA [Defluviitaleaceae bacterium]